ncbi:hypothetical protein QYM36_002758 [Artemia franciscana]|uniref:Uncharacterized protein n=1 Tax=Artemia franciscana TaxID=6661 RepID=A0AA88I6S1_ARTSF|nr:hypothetical protein QYM36_002758 [Artemia franciscana]
MHRTVYRTESEHSEDSSTKRVSFNKDISVKHIPRGAVLDKQGQVIGYLPENEGRKFVRNVYKEPLILNEDDLAEEAARILKQVENADCIVTDAPMIFDTRSLDRPKKTKNSNQEQNNSWSKTLPSTKNKLDSKGKKKDFIEKNNRLNALKSKLMRTNSSSNEILDTIQETSRETLNNSYIKGLERNNLRYSDKNLPAKISNEEIAYKRQYSSEYLDRMPTKTERIDRYKSHDNSPERSNQYVRSYSRNETDPLHSMPGGLIEPIYSLGFTHNRNRPFSYTTGMSPELEKPNKYGDSYKQHSEDRNIYHSTQKVMEKDAILPNKNRNYRESTIPFKENISRPSSIDPMPDRYEHGQENSKFQPNKTVKAKEQFGSPLSNKYSKEGKDGYTTKIMINVNNKKGDLNSAQLVRDASDASQAVGIQSSRLVRQAHNEPPSRPLRAKEKKGENTLRQSVRGNENGHSKLAQRTATLGRVPSQREVPDKRDKRRKVKIVFEYKKASNNEGDPLSRFVEYKGSDLRFARPVTKDLNPMTTLERRAKAEYAEEAIRRHKSEQRFSEDALFDYDRRARSLSPDKMQFGSYDDPEREERIRRQRDKFLTAFFGPGKIPGVMSDENVTRPEKTHIRYEEDDRRRVLSNPDLSTLRRRQFSESPVREYEKAKSKNKKHVEHYDRRDGYGKNRSPVRNGTSESDEGVPRRNLRRSRVDLAVNAPKESLERKNSDFSESDRDYRREMVTKKPTDFQKCGNKWDSLTLNRLEAKNKKNRDKQNTKNDERSETLRRRRMHSSTDVVDNGRSDNHPQQLSEPVKLREPLKGNRKTVRYFGDTDLESEKNAVPYKSVLKQEPSVRRTASSISTSKIGKMDYLKPPELGQHSLSSSLNNSESEGGEGGSQAASASSQRSVYLHATTVADIPVPGYVSQRRRDDSSEYEGVPAIHPVAQAHGGQLKNARHVSRSFSVLAPWKPRHYREKFEINYRMNIVIFVSAKIHKKEKMNSRLNSLTTLELNEVNLVSVKDKQERGIEFIPGNIQQPSATSHVSTSIWTSRKATSTSSETRSG